MTLEKRLKFVARHHKVAPEGVRGRCQCRPELVRAREEFCDYAREDGHDYDAIGRFLDARSGQEVVVMHTNFQARILMAFARLARPEAAP